MSSVSGFDISVHKESCEGNIHTYANLILVIGHIRSCVYGFSKGSWSK